MMGLRAAGFLALAASGAAASLDTAKNKNFGHSIKQAPLPPHRHHRPLAWAAAEGPQAERGRACGAGTAI